MYVHYIVLKFRNTIRLKNILSQNPASQSQASESNDYVPNGQHHEDAQRYFSQELNALR